MKTCLLFIALLSILSCSNGKSWKEIRAQMDELRELIEVLVADVDSAIRKDNAAVGEKAKPKLKEHEAKALRVVDDGRQCAKDETLTKDRMKTVLGKVGEIFSSLKASLSGDLMQLSEETRANIGKMCENGKAAIQQLGEEIIAGLKA